MCFFAHNWCLSLLCRADGQAATLLRARCHPLLRDMPLRQACDPHTALLPCRKACTSSCWPRCALAIPSFVRTPATSRSMRLRARWAAAWHSGSWKGGWAGPGAKGLAWWVKGLRAGGGVRHIPYCYVGYQSAAAQQQGLRAASWVARMEEAPSVDMHITCEQVVTSVSLHSQK